MLKMKFSNVLRVLNILNAECIHKCNLKRSSEMWNVKQQIQINVYLDAALSLKVH